MSERITTVNLHTHTHRCKHARGIPADYAKAAEEKGIRVLGMTDHTPFPDDRVIMIRMGIRSWVIISAKSGKPRRLIRN